MENVITYAENTIAKMCESMEAAGFSPSDELQNRMVMDLMNDFQAEDVTTQEEARPVVQNFLDALAYAAERTSTYL